MNVLFDQGQQESVSWDKNQRNQRVLRFHSAIMCIYFLALLATVFITEDFAVFLFSIPCFFVYCLSFYMSYRLQPANLLKVNFAVLALFVFGFVFVFGWDCGAQHFIFVMMALFFVTSTTGIRRQALRTAALCVTRLLLYGYTMVKEPLYTITPLMGTCFQIVNTIAIFATLFACLSVFMLDMRFIEAEHEIVLERLKRFGQEDQLTGLPNRRSIIEYMENLTRTEQGGNRTDVKVCVALGDVDSFAKINGTNGHDCGDVILRQAAHSLKRFMEGKGRVARWSGEEFLFVFENMNGEDAYYYLTKLQQQMRDMEFYWKDEKISLTMTYGLMEYNPEKSIDYCIVEAGKKREMGKVSGRNTIIY